MKDKFLNILGTIKEFLVKVFSSRLTIVGLIFAILFCVIFGRLFYLQVIKSDYYKENFTQKAQKIIYSEGARGNIYDCNGVLLAHNEVSYSVVMTDEIPSSSTKGDVLNKIVFDTINLIESNGDSLISDFNIEYSDGEAVFKEEPVTPKITFLCNVFGLKSSEIYEKGYDRYTAAEIIDYMCSESRFDIDPETYSLEERIKICVVRYALSKNAYQKYISTEIATDVSEKTQAAIMENRSELTGVDIKETYKRVYDMGEYFGSILGYTGQISEGELESLNESNATGIEYQSDDIVGKAGLEKTYDAYLKGTRGTETVFVNSKGSVIEVVSSTKAGSGNDLYLTIDSELQEAFYEILEREIAGLLVARIVDYDYVPNDVDDIIFIAAKEVYYQLLTNVLDPLKFSNDDASTTEKKIYESFLEKRAEVIENIRSMLYEESALPANQLSDEYNEYMYYLYDFLGEQGILNKDIMNTEDETYLKWAAEEISLKEFLIHAISENWINISALDSSIKYATSDEIFDAMIDTALYEIVDDTDFGNKIYYYMIYNGELAPSEICLALYDQGVLKKVDSTYKKLESGELSAYSFIIQQISNLVITPAMIALDPCSGSIVVTDSATGKVKALVSYPSYDNNKLSGHIDSDYWYELNTDASSPLYNRATQALTAPGSTFKPITAAAGLDTGVINVGTYYYDHGVFEQITPSPKCWVYPEESHGNVNVVDALAVSCNYFFYTVGYDLGMNNGTYDSQTGVDILEKYATEFGLNMKSGVEIEETAPRFSTTDSVRTAIGQGTSAFTTTQLARYVNTISNRGNNFQLSLVDCVKDKEGNVVLNVSPVLNNKVNLSDTIWDAIHSGMRQVITSGTLSGVFYYSNVEVAGKTGTAQENIYRSNHSHFIGYAPYDDPEISFACTIRNGGSSVYAASTTEKCLEFYYGFTTLREILSDGAESITLEGTDD